jgi:hypothetical protein
MGTLHAKQPANRLQAAVNLAASPEDSRATTTVSKRAEESVLKIGYVKPLNERANNNTGAAKK